jgi:hypothetical protein
MTRILIADDHAVVRAGLRELLLQLVLDVSMPGPPFPDLLRRVRAMAPSGASGYLGAAAHDAHSDREMGFSTNADIVQYVARHGLLRQTVS